MEHVFSMLFARSWEFTTKNKKIVRERYVFAGPLCAALPPPPRNFFAFWPWCCGVRVALGHFGHVAPGHLVRMAGANMAGGLGSFGSFGSRFFIAWPCMPAGMLWVIWVIYFA
jgi:hypothetical protein